jgi:hypothetical protein
MYLYKESGDECPDVPICIAGPDKLPKIGLTYLPKLGGDKRPNFPICSNGPDSTGMFPVLIFSQFIGDKETLLNVNLNETKNFLVCENWFDPPSYLDFKLKIFSLAFVV